MDLWASFAEAGRPWRLVFRANLPTNLPATSPGTAGRFLPYPSGALQTLRSAPLQHLLPPPCSDRQNSQDTHRPPPSFREFFKSSAHGCISLNTNPCPAKPVGLPEVIGIKQPQGVVLLFAGKDAPQAPLPSHSREAASFNQSLQRTGATATPAASSDALPPPKQRPRRSPSLVS